MKKLIIILAAFFLVFTSCDTTDPKPPEEKPPGYQEDIPWPSLADSPWPMNHGNAQSTGRGISNRGNSGIIEWEFNFSDNGEDLVSGVVVGSDSLIYFLTEMHFSAGLYCLDHRGNLKWKIVLGSSHRYTTPIITSNKSVIIIDNNILKSFNNNGDLIWDYEFVNSFFWIETPQLDFYGNIYLLDNQKKLYKISSNGELEWSNFNSDFKDGPGTFGMTFSPEGNMLYIPGENTTLIAFNILSQEVSWSYGQESMMTTPIIDNDGNIYCQLNDRAISLNSEGQLRWEFPYDYHVVNDNKPTLDANGNTFFVSQDTLYSLDFHGQFRWNTQLPSNTDSPLICDNEGNVYTGIFNNELSLLKFSNSGKLLLKTSFSSIGNLMQLYSSPIISFNNTILFPAEKKVFAIK